MKLDRVKSTATVATEHADRYMAQRCKHFAHRTSAVWNVREGKVAFEVGEAALRASPGVLLMVITADDPQDLARIEAVMASHLTRFAFREPGLSVDWSRATRA